MTFKPHDLVIVDRGSFSHLSEIISHPIEPDTIMIRMVPDDPSTMVEFPVNRLKKCTTKYKYVHYATVSGQGQFPVDMLRYDFASPVNFKICHDESGRNEIIKTDDSDCLIIARCTELKSTKWTNARWSSFMWTIKPLKTLKLER